MTAPLQDCCSSGVWRGGEQGVGGVWGGRGDPARAKLLVTAGALVGAGGYSAKCLHCSSASSSAATFSLGRKVWWELTPRGKQERLSASPPGRLSRKAAVRVNSRLLPFHFLTLPSACPSRYNWPPERASDEPTAGAEDKRPGFARGFVSLKRCSPAKLYIHSIAHMGWEITLEVWSSFTK